MSQDEAVHIVPYDPTWPKKFELEKKLLEETIGSYITGGIHHIGSTSIPRLSAKPIIDIMVGVDSLVASKPCIEILKSIDYLYFPYKADQEHWFCKPSPTHRTHHLHIIPTKDFRFQELLSFRDYLRTHAKERDAYQALKQKLAQQFRNDREAYTEAKADFIKDIVYKALSTD